MSRAAVPKISPSPSGPSLLIPGRRLRAAYVGTLVALGFILVCHLESPLAASGTPDLSGTWELDEALSEDPMQLRGRGGRDSGGFGGGIGGGGWGGGGWGGGRPGGGIGSGPPGGMQSSRDRRESREEMERRMRELRKSVERLRIAQTGDSLRMTFADGREHAIATNNKKTIIETPQGEAEVKAKWRDGSLIVTTKTGRRATIETYHLTADRTLLTVVVEMASDGPRGPVSFKRIYRPLDAEAESLPEPR
ncbi:MAG: hypothetical protein OEM62_03235 [Acidobacteriota bacterium]|nr:hypothetical protein [Acidobacteriota bacterium]